MAIRSEVGLPLRYVGLGERPQDLAEFDAEVIDLDIDWAIDEVRDE